MKTKYIVYDLAKTCDPGRRYCNSAFLRLDLKLWSKGYVRLPDRGEFAVYRWEVVK